MGKIWAVCSGSGGVGKTTLALFLAFGAAQKGKQIVLLDASGISRSCDLLLGLESVITIDMGDVLTQQMDIQSALYPVPGCENLRLANASLYEGIPLSELSGVILAIQSLCDVLIVDLPTGQLLSGDGIMIDTDEWLIITRPDDASIRAAERLMQRARETRAGVSMIVNRVRKERVKRGQQYTDDAVSMILDCPVLGAVPEDDGFSACRTQKKTADWKRIVQHAAIQGILNRLLHAAE